MIRRPFTSTEVLHLLLAAAAAQASGDPALADLLERLAGGDDTALPELHDHCNIVGRPEIADRIRRLVLEDNDD